MKKIILTLYLLVGCFMLFSQNSDVLSLYEIKQELGYDYEDGYTNNDAYYLTYNKNMTIEGNTIPKLIVYYFDGDKKSSKLMNVVHVASIDFVNQIVKQLNSMYVKRDGELIWDDYQDNTSVKMTISKEDELISWTWQ